jgi:tyrosinase
MRIHWWTPVSSSSDPGLLTTEIQELIRSKQSWWDETKDAGKFSKAKVFNTTLGFGGSGQGSKNCLADGPYANLQVNIGQGFQTNARCVNRKLTDSLSSQCSAAEVTKAISGKSYDEAWLAIYMGPHLYGHMALAMMVCILQQP